MIAAFLLPFPFRGYRSPYLWVYYRLMTAFDEPMLFIASHDYLTDPDLWAAQGRWELQAHSQSRLGYRIPTSAEMQRHRYGLLPGALFETLLAEAGGNPVAAFRRLLTERIPALEGAIETALADTRDLEAVLTWCNCPSLSAVAARRGVPVLHLEAGPLRWPHYRATGYLDFQGVNGHTEAAVRHQQAKPRFGPEVTRNRLRAFFYTGVAPVQTRTHALGLPLQVEDDSNLVAFGHDHDNQALLIRALLARPDRDVLVRAHPGSVFALKPDWYRLDDSPDSITFIGRCRRVLTVNSSVGLEALLWNTPVEALGDSSYQHLVDADDPVGALAFYLFAYLVPMDLIYQPDYLRFRLTRPSESAIVARHLDAYGVAHAGPQADLPVLVAQALAGIDAEVV